MKNSKQTTSARTASGKTRATSSGKRTHKPATLSGKASQNKSKVSAKKGGAFGNSAGTGGDSRKIKGETEKVLYPDGLVLPKADIHALVDKTPHLQVLKMCAILMGVYKACDSSAKKNYLEYKDRMDCRGLELVEALPKLDGNRKFRQLLKLVRAAVGNGSAGIKASRETASEFVYYAHRDPYGEQGLRVTQFRELLEEAGLLHLLKAVEEIPED